MFADGLVSLIADNFIFPFVQYRSTDANVQAISLADTRRVQSAMTA